MTKEIQSLYNVWLNNRTLQTTSSSQLSFDDFTNSIITAGPFYYYVIDFFDMSLSHINPAIYETHGFSPETVTFNSILEVIHPEDINYVISAEAFLTKLFCETIGREKLLKYKISYCFRARLKNGKYGLINHQALMLSLDDQGKYGKSLNIHTCIDHLSATNTYKISLIGLDGEPSFMNLSLDEENSENKEFSKREIDIIKNIAEGLSTLEIAAKLFISPLTVKKHRTNILKKCNSKNTVELIKNCVLQGLI